MKKIASTSRKDLSKIKVSKLSDDVFVQINSSVSSKSIAYLKREANAPTFDENNPSKSHDQFIRYASTTTKPAHYAMNFQSNSLTPQLEKFAINIGANVNKSTANNAGFGINTPSFYLAGPGATTAMHPEDGYLDAINLMLYSEQNAVKIWLIVHPAFSPYVNHAVAARLREFQGKKLPLEVGNLLKKWSHECAFPLHHKSLLLTTEFFDTNKIAYRMVVQRPGDIVYVRPAIYHQVVNTGPTLAEAVNVGSALWLTCAALFMTCDCPDCCITYVVPNTNQPDNEIRIIQPSLMFACNICTAHFNTEDELDEHTLLHDRFKCDTCDLVFSRVQGLNRHRKRICE